MTVPKRVQAHDVTPISNEVYHGIYRVFILWLERETRGGSYDDHLTTQEIYERFHAETPHHTTSRGVLQSTSRTSVGRWLAVYWEERQLAWGKSHHPVDRRVIWRGIRWRDEAQRESDRPVQRGVAG